MSDPVVLSYSGGKDSVFALAALRADGWDVRAALAAFTADDRALVMHRVPERLIELQTASLAVPIARFLVPRDAPNAVYEAELAAALAPFRSQGVRHVAFGDLFLAEIKDYRDALMARLGFEPVYPLWGRDTESLAECFVREGYRGITVCVDGSKLAGEWAGREMDAAFFANLPAGVDLCGENGEFHSFVYDGPGFSYPVRFTRGEPFTAGSFHYCRLCPLSGEACGRCGAIFECGMKAGVEPCWCANLPALAPNAAWRTCLCPRCLRDQAVSASDRSPR
jgi:uncharacterized protein (TIGR00290 family)